MMKFTVLLIIAFSLQSFAHGYGQENINLNLEKVTLKKVFKAIEQQGACRFVYKDEILPREQRISISVANASLEEVMNKVLQNTELSYKRLSGSLVVITTGMEAAIPVPVSGKVTSDSGEPLSGVSVTEKGSTNGTVTDGDGNFVINVSNTNAVLIVTYIGFVSKEVSLNGSSQVSVSLVAENKNLEEVVVVGYGTQKRRSVTGAITSVKASDLENMPIMRVDQALQGRVSGMTIAAASGQPGSSSTLRIRGTTTLNNSDPLFVVDGIVVDNGGIDYLNQNDIESIEVLKDAASAAIYGARSASGVILVTTKKGKAGTMAVNYNGYVGMQEPATRLKLLNAKEYATLSNEAFAAGGGTGLLFPNPDALGEGTNWQDQIFSNNALIQNHDISISAGSEKSTYYFSLGYFEQEGVVMPEISAYKRYNARLNSNHKITKWLTFGNTLGYSYIRSQGIGNTNGEFGGPLASAINLDPITSPIVTDPNDANAPVYVNNRVVRDGQGRPYGISNYVRQEMTNPLAYAKTREGNHGWSHNLVGNVFAEIEVIKGLKVRTNLGAKQAFWGATSFNPMVFLNTSTFTTNNSFTRELNRGFNWTFENTISYARRIGDHNFTLLGGTGAYVDDNSVNSGITVDNLPVNTYGEASMNFESTPANRRSWGGESYRHKVSSIYGRLVYDYNDKYLFTAILRRDGSSRFGSNNKYGYFPSGSIGWVASKEDFFPQNNVVSFLKIRGSYGETGNDGFGNFAFISTMGGGRNYPFGNDNYLIGYSPNAPANPDLRWESTSQLNIGFDANLFKNLTLTFDWYKKKTRDILMEVAIPAYVGLNNPLGNVGAMENTGVELELGYSQKLGDVNFNVKGNISYVKNTVTDIGEEREFIDGSSWQASTYRLTRAVVGRPTYSFYGFETAGIFQNQAEVANYQNKDGKVIQPNAVPGDFKWVDRDGDGVITEADRTFIGDPTPTWSYGFTINASYKQFDLVLFGQGVTGNQIFNALRRLDVANANWTTAALGRWTGEGSTNSFPRLTTKDNNSNFAYPSDFYLSDGAYFRIKNLQIGYTVPASLLNRAGIKKLRVYVASGNLLTLTKYTGFDPEIGGGSYGIDRGVYPQARSFMVGLNVGL
ncbi:TonB-dependent receptor [Terrimonas sp. NA20]|uniref:TonB-dependent receptor n=1 Tax=Terrimonas ginsenosidimutans TaxID=2908004 RepID=A0ABS9KYF0_9BACT|nr:TonB-dependent receptor [Terrimonas ginsenosidimutans]MCG2617244.1 TonB-dependent receptor [Terrimonas ginsenosidimutans]